MTSASELHVIYGSGPVGTAVAEILVAERKRVRVVTHSGARKHLSPRIEVVRGDATDPADVRQVAAGASHIYNCTNPCDYQRWPEQVPPLQRGVLEGAAAIGAKLIVIENLYMYGPHGGAPMTEATPMNGRGSRSTTRVRMTEELFDAHRSGKVRVASVRASDLFGPHVSESLVGQRLFAPLLAGKPAQLFANLDVPHSVSFIRDVGRALVTVGAHDAALGRAWHAPNALAVTLRQFIDILGAEAGVVSRASALARPVTRALLPALGVFVPALRGLEENLYISYEPYIVDHGAYAAAFGDHATPLREAIRETVEWYRGRPVEGQR
jgi:nucleoside-diphosphate-sugar epimerase